MVAITAATDGGKPPDRSFKDALVSSSWQPATIPCKAAAIEHRAGSHKGELAIYFPAKHITAISEWFSGALIGKFSKGYNKSNPRLGRPPVEDLHKYFTALDLKQSVKLGLLDNRHVLIQTSHNEDFIRLYSRPVWYVRGMAMRIFKWTPSFHVDRESSFVPVWVSFPRLPIHYFDPQTLKTIATLLGSPLRLDSSTTTLNRPSIARVQIELDLLKPRPERIWIGTIGESGFWQYLEYGEVPDYCQHCWHVGHSDSHCTVHHPKLKALDQKRERSSLGPKQKVVYVAKPAKTKITDQKHDELCPGEPTATNPSSTTVVDPAPIQLNQIAEHLLPLETNPTSPAENIHEPDELQGIPLEQSRVNLGVILPTEENAEFLNEQEDPQERRLGTMACIPHTGEHAVSNGSATQNKKDAKNQPPVKQTLTTPHPKSAIVIPDSLPKPLAVHNPNDAANQHCQPTVEHQKSPLQIPSSPSADHSSQQSPNRALPPGRSHAIQATAADAKPALSTEGATQITPSQLLPNRVFFTEGSTQIPPSYQHKSPEITTNLIGKDMVNLSAMGSESSEGVGPNIIFGSGSLEIVLSASSQSTRTFVEPNHDYDSHSDEALNTEDDNEFFDKQFVRDDFYLDQRKSRRQSRENASVALRRNRGRLPGTRKPILI